MDRQNGLDRQLDRQLNRLYRQNGLERQTRKTDRLDRHCKHKNTSQHVVKPQKTPLTVYTDIFT